MPQWLHFDKLLFFEQIRPLFYFDNYNRDDKIFFHWTTLVPEHPFFNIPYFSRSFSISGYYSTQYGLKLTGLPVEKSTVVEISSNKTLHHLLMNWLTSNPDLLSRFQIRRHEKKFAHIFKKQKEFLNSRLNNNFSFLFVYHTLFAYLSLLT